MPHSRPLADELYLTAHDDRDGRPRQPTHSIGLGLGGALLAELMLHGRVVVHEGMVVVGDRRPPSDALAHVVLDQLIGEPELHPLRTWISFLGQSSVERVAERLERAGYLTRVQSRRRLRAEVRYVPTNAEAAATPGAVLRLELVNERPLEVVDATLAGLVDATGLSPTVLWGTTTRTAQLLDWCVSNLHPYLRELIAETKATVGNAVLTR